MAEGIFSVAGLLITIFFIVIVVLIIRLLGAWMLRINEVIRQQTLTNEILEDISKAVISLETTKHSKSLDSPKENIGQINYDDSKVLTTMNNNKASLLDEIKKVNDNLRKIHGGV